MSHNNPVPPKLQRDFVRYVTKYRDDSYPDTHWGELVESLCMRFMERHGLQGRADKAAKQYLKLLQKESNP